jgi:hypothetical protein
MKPFVVAYTAPLICRNRTGVTPGGEQQKAEPMAERPLRQACDEVSLWLSRELVAIPRDDQEVLNVNSNRLAVAPPKRSDRVQQEGQRVHTDVPELLVPVPILLFESRYQVTTGGVM